MRAWLIERTLAASHTVIGRVRRDLALYEVPKPPGLRGRGRPRKYGARMTRQKIEALPVHRTAQILYGNLEVVRDRTCRVAARFLKGRVVRMHAAKTPSGARVDLVLFGDGARHGQDRRSGAGAPLFDLP